MGEVKQVYFSFKEVAEALVKQQGLHEGIWGIIVEFGLRAATAGPSDEQIYPTALIPVLKIGLQRNEKEDRLSVDAAKVNPASKPSKRGLANTAKVSPAISTKPKK